jgi:Tol biopolymer transport system component
MRYGLGIDLGTTQTAAAVWAEGRVEVARLGGRRAEIPSLVFVKPDGGLLIGEAAERRGQSEPARLAREFKRRIGDPVPILVGGTPFSAHALTAKLLRNVLDTVGQLQGGPPSAITVTHPANWGPYKREQLDQAVRLADAGPVLLRTEPEAAALQHATARRIAPGETVAVYDLGGGTFDAAVLRRDGDGFVLLGEPEGIEQLGGIDFDEAVFGHVLGVLGGMVEGIDPSDPEAVAALSRLRRDCVEAKEALSFDTETMIPVALPGLHTRVRLNRSELESMIAPSLADTVTATKRALRGAGVAPEQLNAILLAGGSSRIPLVSELLSTEFQRPVVADPHPEHSIAMGAAVATATVLGGASPFSAAITPPTPQQPGYSPVPVISPRGSGQSPATGEYSPVATPGGGYSPSAMPGGAPSGRDHVTAATADSGYSSATAQGSGYSSADTRDSGYSSAGTRDSGYSPGGQDGGYSAAATPGGRSQDGGHPAKGTPYVTPPGSGGYFPATPQGSTSPPAGGVAPVSGGPAPVSPASGTVYSRGAASVPGAAGASQGAVGVPGTRAGAGAAHPVPISGSGAGTAPGAAVGSAPSPGFGVAPGGNPPWPPPPAPSRRPRRLIVAAAAVGILLVAGGTTTVVLLVNRDKHKTVSGAPTTGPATAGTSASAKAAAVPYPIDTMLVRVDTGPPSPPGRQSKVYRLVPGTDALSILPGTQVGDVLPKWSHSREQIALTHVAPDNKSSDIYVMNADGSDRHLAVAGGGGRVAWSADDTKIAFMKKDGAGDSQIFVKNLDTGDLKQLTFSATQKDDAAWSPDGKHIIYWLNRNDVKQIYELTVADPQEPGRRITGPGAGPANDPVYSPNGQQILFTRELDGGATSDIWIVNRDGSGARRITSDPQREMDPTWSPDGKWFAFVRGDYGAPTIVIERTDGTGETVLTKPGIREGHPCWF